jgi:hypothetical protein
LGTIGSEALLQTRKLALLCSRACPGSIIVQVLDAVRALRETAWTVVSGFQSPTEQECLEILLRGGHPVIVCPARRPPVAARFTPPSDNTERPRSDAALQSW